MGEEKFDQQKRIVAKGFLPALICMFLFVLTYAIIFRIHLDELDNLTAQGTICVYDGVNVNEKWCTLWNWGWIMFLILSIIYAIGIIAAVFG